MNQGARAKSTAGKARFAAAVEAIAARKQRGDRARPVAEAADVGIGVTPEAGRHGDYRQTEFVEKAGERPIKVLRNRGGTTIDRWLNAGRLSREQASAVALYAKAHAAWLGEPKITASYQPAISRGESVERFADRRLAAKAVILRLDEAVFARMPAIYADVWKNVVLADEPAGLAGGRLGQCSGQAQGAALAIVQLIADMIVMQMGLKAVA